MSNEFSVANQLEIPITETVDGNSVDFPRLVMADVTAWAAAIAKKRKTEAGMRIAADGSLSPFDRQRLLQSIEDEDVELGTVLAKSFTPAGITKTLVLSLKKTGKSDEQALAVIGRIHYRRQLELAQEVLSPPKPVAPAKGDGSANPPETDSDPITG